MLPSTNESGLNTGSVDNGGECKSKIGEFEFVGEGPDHGELELDFIRDDNTVEDDLDNCELELDCTGDGNSVEDI